MKGSNRKIYKAEYKGLIPDGSQEEWEHGKESLSELDTANTLLIPPPSVVAVGVFFTITHYHQIDMGGCGGLLLLLWVLC